MSWERMSKVIERYERIAVNEIRELKKIQKTVIETPARNSTNARSQLKRLEDELLNGLNTLLTMRGELDSNSQEKFDERIEPLRKQIQSAVAMNKNLPPVTSSTNPFDEDEPVDDNPYEQESRRYVQETDTHAMAMRLKAEEARSMAEATAKLNKDIQDLEQIFTDLATLVHEQHDMVDSIEEHVEQATHEVQRGNEELKKAVKHKAAKAPVVAAVVGGLAVGGPVGVAAGSAIAGIAAGVGGLIAGVYGGKWFKNSVKNDLESS